MAKERRIAGAPSDLNVKYCTAGVNIGESYKREGDKEQPIIWGIANISEKIYATTNT